MSRFVSWMLLIGWAACGAAQEPLVVDFGGPRPGLRVGPEFVIRVVDSEGRPVRGAAIVIRVTRVHPIQRRPTRHLASASGGQNSGVTTMQTGMILMSGWRDASRSMVHTCR